MKYPILIQTFYCTNNSLGTSAAVHTVVHEFDTRIAADIAVKAIESCDARDTRTATTAVTKLYGPLEKKDTNSCI